MKTLPAGTRLTCVAGHTIGFTTRDIDPHVEPNVQRDMFRFVPDDTILWHAGAYPHRCPECGAIWTRNPAGYIHTEEGWYP